MQSDYKVLLIRFEKVSWYFKW